MDFSTTCVKLIQGKYVKCIENAITEEIAIQNFDEVMNQVNVMMTMH